MPAPNPRSTIHAGDALRLPSIHAAIALRGADRLAPDVPLLDDTHVMPPRPSQRTRPGVRARRVPALAAANVKPAHSLVPPLDRQLGDLPGHRRVPHGGHQQSHHDRPARCRTSLLAVGEPGQHGVDDLVEGHAAVDVQLGSEPDLGVDHRVLGQVLYALVRHPVQRLGGLHHRHGVRERLQVALQRAAVRAGAKPGRQLLDVGGGQPVVAGLPGDVQHGRRAQAAVEVIVQQGLGRLADLLELQWCGHVTIRSMISGRGAGAPSPTFQPPSSSASAAPKRSGVSV